MNNVNERNLNDHREQYESPCIAAWRFDEPNTLAGLSFNEGGVAKLNEEIWGDDE